MLCGAPARGAESALQSPYLREVEFHRQQAEPLFALGTLLAARRQERLGQNANSLELLAGRLYQDYGLPGQAADSFQRAEGAGVGSLRGRAWWELARQRFERGEYDRAAAALNRTTGLLPYELEQRRPLLQAQILMAQNKNAEAAALLKGFAPIQQQEPYSRYNIGVALIRSGDLLGGAGMLDSVGTMPAPNEEMLALRDQANLAMGYGFLRADQGATARPLFKRVRLDGALSNLALLGAGWAELAPDGKPQQNMFLSPVGCVEDATRVLPETLLVLRRPPRPACDRERTFKARVFFEQAPGADSEAERYRRAIVPWQTLARRSPADPAVQEALLALPYAYGRLKGRDQAVEHYRNAVARYEEERRQIEKATETVSEAPFLAETPEGTDTVWRLPRPEDALYLRKLTASGEFRSALGDLRALRTLSSQLGTLDRQVETLEAGFDRTSEPVTLAAADGGGEVTPVPDTAPASRRITYFGVFDVMPSPATAETATIDEVDEPALAVEEEAEPPPPTPRSTRPDPQPRYRELETRLAGLRAQLADAQKKHETALRAAARAELGAQQARLDIYLSQARISLARLLDPDASDTTRP